LCADLARAARVAALAPHRAAAAAWGAADPHRGAEQPPLGDGAARRRADPRRSARAGAATVAPGRRRREGAQAGARPEEISARAARHAADGRVRNVLEHRALPPWEPRRFRFVEPTLSLLARARIDIPGDGPAPPVPDGGAPPAVMDEKALEARWLNSLRTFER